jgi:hypothetical protein
VLPREKGAFSSSLGYTSRFAGLVDVYAALATSDPVLQLLRARGMIDEEDLANGENPIAAAAVVSTVNGGTPMMTITGRAKTGLDATRLTRGATSAFVSFVESRQRAAKIPAKDRIQIRVVKSSEAPTLLEPRSKALPILIFLAGLIATAGIAFTRDGTKLRSAVASPQAPVLAPTATHSEPVESPPAAVPSAVGAAVPHSRWTLGSVPHPESVTRGRDLPDERSARS